MTTNSVQTHCPNCDNPVTETMEEDSFPYGSGPDPIYITVTVPVLHCDTCKFDYCDYRAENIRESAVSLLKTTTSED